MIHLSRRDFGRALAAQATFTTGVKVVSVLASVRGRDGAFVRDLSRDDFTVLENGRPQVISYFSRETDLPLTLGLLVDTSMSQERVMAQQRGAAFRFLNQVLRPRSDQVFILQFDMGVFFAQGLTADWRAIENALSLVDTPTRAELNRPTSRGTLLYDAIVRAGTVLREPTGRKAMIVLTDGVDVGSDSDLPGAIDAALRVDALVYPILFTGFNGGARNVLARLGRETGGAFLEVRKGLDIDGAFSKIGEELRSQYSLGYVSDDPVRMEGFRRIEVRARGGLVVQARSRYWAVP